MGEHKKINPVTLVRAWLDGDNVEEVAESLGVSRESLLARISRLKRSGVKVPPRKSVIRKLDIDVLNGIIEKHQQESDEEI